LTILRSSFFGGFGGAVGADAEEVGGGEFAFSTLAEDARVIWLRRRYCFCCLRVNELVVVVVELNWLVNDCVANIMVSLLKKKSASARAFTRHFNCGVGRKGPGAARASALLRLGTTTVIFFHLFSYR
jgi:hypothetical protein